MRGELSDQNVSIAHQLHLGHQSEAGVAVAVVKTLCACNVCVGGYPSGRECALAKN
jgi:hypothetical protein